MQYSKKYNLFYKSKNIFIQNHFLKKVKTSSFLKSFLNKVFIKSYYKKVQFISKNFSRFPLRERRYKKKKILFKLFSNYLFSNKLKENTNILLQLRGIIFTLFYRLRKVQKLHSVRLDPKDVTILQRFVESLNFLILLHNFLHTKSKELILFILKKQQNFLRFRLNKILYLFFKYHKLFFTCIQGRVTYTDFYRKAMNIFFQIIKINFDTIHFVPFFHPSFNFPNKTLRLNKALTTGLYEKLVGLIQKKGLKSKANQILNKTLILISKELKISVKNILLSIFNKLKTSVETRTVDVRRRLHEVPSPVNFKRKMFLIAKWLLKSVFKDKKKRSIILKLKYHITKVLQSNNSLPYKTKKYYINKAIENRSNFHYRWW